jgi:acyl-CoA reductase-like NAD-dependent aldehyde dehydrogenase
MMTEAAGNRPLHRHLFIDGEWRPARDAGLIERLDPATGELFATFARAGREDALAAVQAARKAFDGGDWPHTLPAERASVLLQAALLLEQRSEQMAVWESVTSGAPLGQARMMMEWVVDVFRYYAGLARTIAGNTTSYGRSQLGMTLMEPVGVVSLIVPWNFPLNQAAWKIAPALAAGCTAVVKPDSKTALTTLEMAAILKEAGLPDGALNVVVGEPAEIGEVLTAHPDIDLVSITGSTETGKTVMRNAANSVKPVHLELGGKSPNLIFPDADLSAAATSAAWAIFWRCGQVCTAGSRLLVHSSIRNEVVALLKKTAQSMALGMPSDDDTVLGPLISEEHLQRVEGYVRKGIEEGATLALGGERLREPPFDKGSYFPPTVFTDVSSDMTIAREEIFGPVVAVITFDSTREAIELANETIFGLASAVWTKDLSTALQVSRGIRAGTVWVNNYGLVHAEMPVGGYKMSGYGRELGQQALETYLQTKSVHLTFDALN